MSIDGMGPLALASVASHVAVRLDRAAHVALSYGDLADGYVHPIPADLGRVRKFTGLSSQRDVVEWMVVKAVEGLTPRDSVIVTDGKVALAEGVTIDNLRFQRRKVYEVQNPHAKLRDPFNPMSGEFSDNIRRDLGSLDELRESMREFGWLPQFPAIKDERGVVLVGHRRLAVAAELEIEPVVIEVPCGEGDNGEDGQGGDAKRFRLAIGSNLGGKAFTPTERARIAKYLYGSGDWTMTALGKALGVTQGTISKDLYGFIPRNKPNRPEGGRPKSTLAPNRIEIPELKEEVKELVATNSPIPETDLMMKYGVSATVVQRETSTERGRVEGRTEPRPLPHCATCTCVEET